MFPKTYAIVQEAATDRQHILGLLLSIELHSQNATCVVCCDEEVKNFIINFPKRIHLTLDFIMISQEVKLHCLTYIQNILHTLSYAITAYNDCLFVSKDLIMTNPIQISDTVLNQNIGFIKKTTGIEREEKEFTRYSFNVLYVADLNYVKLIQTYFENQLNCANFQDYTLNLEDNALLKTQVEQCISFYNKLPHFLVQEYQLTEFLDKYSYVGTEDFFAFEQELKLCDIDNNLTIYEHRIAFCGIRLATPEKIIQQFNNDFLNLLFNNDVLYMSLINIKLSEKKLQFVVPNPDGVGIWNRKNETNSGLYEMIELLTENYSSYVSKEEVRLDYFSFGNYLLTDKPAHIWLNNTIKQYSGILICNYDTSLIDALAPLSISNKFLAYYAYSPKLLEEYLRQLEESKLDIAVLRTITMVQVKQNTNLNFTITYLEKDTYNEEVDYLMLLKNLRTVKYCFIQPFDVKLIATCFALGVVPVLDNTIVYDLTENVHYVKAVPTLNDTDDVYPALQQNGLKYYKEHIQSTAFLNKLLQHIFVRNLN